MIQHNPSPPDSAPFKSLTYQALVK
jgi:hypothetical protein